MSSCDRGGTHRYCALQTSTHTHNSYINPHTSLNSIHTTKIMVARSGMRCDFRPRCKLQKSACVEQTAYYINLSQRQERNRKMQARCRAAGVFATRFEAVTGDCASDADVSREWNTTLNARFDNAMMPGRIATLTPGERGCAASHVALWRQCVAAAGPLLVMEDDLVVCDHFGIYVQELIATVEAAFPCADRALLMYLGAFVGP